MEEAEVRPVLEAYCFKCHSERKAEGGISFEEFGGALDVWRSRKEWVRVRDAIDGGRMPPEEAKELPVGVRAGLSEWIGRTLADVDVSRLPVDPGHVVPRRLNRTEYGYTVSDLFGIGSVASKKLPEDQVSEGGFDNEAATLAVQPLVVEKFLEAADAVVAEVWGDRAALERLIFERPPGGEGNKEGKVPVAGVGRGQDPDMGAGVFTVVVRFRTREGGALIAKAPAGDEWVPGAKVLTVSDGGELIYDIGWVGQKRGRRKVNDGGWHTAVLHQRGEKMTVHVDGELEIEASGMMRPDVVGHRFKVGAAGGEFTAFRGEIEAVRYYRPGVGDDEVPRVSRGEGMSRKPDLEWVTREGGEAEAFNESAAARRVLGRFLGLAFRREVGEEEVERYLALFRGARASGDDYVTAMKLPVRAALVSPAFLYRAEEVQTVGGAYRVSGRELANRLSYFLWMSLPDERLAELGERGSLADGAVLDAEVVRMLRDPRSQRMSRAFGMQWLRIGGLGQKIRPDRALYPNADDALLEAMKEESVLFVDSVFREDLPLKTLLDADYTFANERLAAHYGMLGVAGEEMRRVEFDGGGTGRGGVLTQASVLTVTSSPRRSSPVFRGKWILDVVLGQPPPPPPPNVPELGAAAEKGVGSLRDALGAHRADAACASCHDRIDPLGFALEAFDATGRLREGLVDNAGVLPDGSAFEGHEGLKVLLRTKREGEFVRHFASRLLVFALGRELSFTDERALQTLLTRVREAGGSSRALVREIVSSYPFQYSKQPETPEGKQTR
jgi:hypothetical protein